MPGLQLGEIYHLSPETVARLLPHGEGARMIREADVSLRDEYPFIVAQADFQLESLKAIHLAHFPGHPVLMGGLLLDAMAQTIVLLIRYMEEEETSKENNLAVFLYRLDGIEFPNPVNPFEDLVTIEAYVTKLSVVSARGRGIARVGGNTVCTVEKIVGARQNAREMRNLYLRKASL